MAPRKTRTSFAERFSSLTPWLAGIIFGGLVNTGVMYQQFQEVRKTQEEVKEELKQQALRLAEFREKQIASLADIQVLKGNIQNLDNRVLVIERIFVEKPQQFQAYPQQQQGRSRQLLHWKGGDLVY